MHLNTASNPAYIGRFAPSPTGELHFGSLVTALSSYLDAKSHGGQWLVRMEDIDPPREIDGAADSILRSLEAHYLFWDQDVLFQSSRLEAYEEKLNQLSSLCYACNCTRKRIMTLNSGYDRHCLHNKPQSTHQTATRLKIDQLNNNQKLKAENFEDAFLGQQHFALSDVGDMIIKRKDGLFAYQLAVAVDDLYQNITHIIRGYDLIDSTSRQRYIMLLLKLFSNENHLTLPVYGHSPLALGKDGSKLSKQTHAAPLNNQLSYDNLSRALIFLNHPPPQNEFATQNCQTLLAWATENWQRSKLPKHSELAP